MVLFVADGLRPGMVTEQTAPAMTALIRKGVSFANSHSVFPTFTTPNAASMATGHYPGDHGDFSNTIYTGFPVPGAGDSVTPFLESDPVLGDVDEHFAGNYLDEETILRAAREKGFSTATIGKLGPALIMDHLANRRDKAVVPDSIVVDDSTGSPAGRRAFGRGQGADRRRRAARQGAGPRPQQERGLRDRAGDLVGQCRAAGLFRQSRDQGGAAFVQGAEKALRSGLLVARSRRQPAQPGRQPAALVPGINGPTSLAAIRNADNNLASLLEALKAEGLDGDTDVILASDHGFSTISKESATSWAATQTIPGVPAHLLPPGFLAIDLAHALGLPLFDPDAKNAPVAAGAFPSRANGLIGLDPAKPDVVVAANGGSDLVYLPNKDSALARKIVAILSAQDYVSGLFADDDFGAIPGTLPLSAIALKGSAVTPLPAIVVNFRSFATGCDDPTICGVEVADTALQQGQGMHGNFSRADTRNIMAAFGPSFRKASWTGRPRATPISARPSRGCSIYA